VFWQLFCIYYKCTPRNRVSKSRHKEEGEEKRFNLLNAHKGSHQLTDNTVRDKTTMKSAVIKIQTLKFSLFSYLSLLAIVVVVQKDFL